MSLTMTSRQADVTVDGSTHASSVIPPRIWRLAELATLIRAFVPLKRRAPPYLPAVVQTAFEKRPSLPFPDASCTRVPLPSSKEYAATSDGAAALPDRTWTAPATVPAHTMQITSMFMALDNTDELLSDGGRAELQALR